MVVVGASVVVGAAVVGASVVVVATVVVVVLGISVVLGAAVVTTVCKVDVSSSSPPQAARPNVTARAMTASLFTAPTLPGLGHVVRLTLHRSCGVVSPEADSKGWVATS